MVSIRLALAAYHNEVLRVLELTVAIKDVYRPFAPANGSLQPTDTLVTKVVLGTVACLPACDRYFVDGFKSEGFKYGSLKRSFVEGVLDFCWHHRQELEGEQGRIEQSAGLRYPIMKLVDMYFWQIGYERDIKSQATT